MNRHQDHRAYIPMPFSPFPGGVPGGFPPFSGGTPGLPQNITPPPPQLLQSFQQLSQSPMQAQGFVQQQQSQHHQGPVTFAAGCENRWTIIVTRTFNVFLMYVTSTNPRGFTRGFIYPTYSFANFPSSVILWYSCF